MENGLLRGQSGSAKTTWETIAVIQVRDGICGLIIVAEKKW